jgi:hypothetical protein
MMIGGMKMKIVIWLLGLSLAQSLLGQETTNFLFRNRFPIVNDTIRCDLSPLFAWWTRQMAVQTAVTNTNNPGFATNTTPDPMPLWLHISGQILQEIPEGWIVNGNLETAPGRGYSTRILVVHPPRNELNRFMQRDALLKEPLPTPDYSEQEAKISAADNRAFIANTIGDDDLEDFYASEADRERRDLEDLKKRDQNLVKERADAVAALGNFPSGWQTYRVDLFALNTGRWLQGLPVFDAGLSFTK